MYLKDLYRYSHIGSIKNKILLLYYQTIVNILSDYEWDGQ